MPLKDSFKFKKSRIFKIQIDEFYGKGAGLEFLKLGGTRLGILATFSGPIIECNDCQR